MDKIYIGAYTTSPCLDHWDPVSEELYFHLIKKNMPDLSGLELPFWGDSLYKYEKRFFYKFMDPNWNYTVTCVPGSMELMKKNPHAGLSSECPLGRKQAIEMCRKLWIDIQEFNAFKGRNVIKSIQLPSSPTPLSKNVNVSWKLLLLSLEEIMSWGWGETQILLEHCDSYEGIGKEKGFLSIEDEIKCLEILGGESSRVGLLINWARSAIEGRSIQTPIEHILIAKHHGLLKGLIFSGVSDNTNNLNGYGYWKDLHAPLKSFNRNEGESTSLLDKDNVYKCLDLVQGSLDFAGFKFLSMPINQSSMERRIGVNMAMYSLLKDYQ